MATRFGKDMEMDVDHFDDFSVPQNLARDEIANFVQSDAVLYAALNFTGKRLLLCGGDGRLSIWNQKDNGHWQLGAQWKVHNSPVVEAAWAHPEFGDLIATCSADKSVYIWEEISSVTRAQVTRKWIRKAYIPDSTNTVTSFSFGPRHLGLILATATIRGGIRIFEALDPMDTSHWKLIHELQPYYVKCGSIAWTSSPVHKVLLAVGTDDAKTKKDQRVVVYELNETLKKFQQLHSIKIDLSLPVTDLTFSPIITEDGHELAVTAGEVYIYSLKTPLLNDQEDDGALITDVSDTSAVKICALELGSRDEKWRCKYLVDGNTLVASGLSGIKVFKSTLRQKWTLMNHVDPDTIVQGVSGCHSTKVTADSDEGPCIAPAQHNLVH